jgi:NAD-dependent dihydropyrimidine dehydrogenase PreA subunit
MIEIVDGAKCITCDRCIEVCPTRVFERGADGVPVIARHDSCQTCFQCEAYCPVDALFVAPLVHPVPPDSPYLSEDTLEKSGLLGGYRRVLGWGRGRTLGARVAVQPQAPQ